MAHHFWITGTDTDVGKTLVTTLLMRYYQSKGAKVIPYKPIQTGMIAGNINCDTAFYQLCSKEILTKDHLNSYSLKEPVSPHYAAMLEGTVISEETILQHIRHLTSMYDCVICEGAGGLYVPLDEKRNYHFLDLIFQSNLPGVLVARTKLGTINHTLLSIEALRGKGIPIAGIVFNKFEGTNLEMDNITTIQKLTELPTLVIPMLKDLSQLKELQIENTEFFERLLSI